ncbi:MAG: site-specific DNA-methyltransferase [Ignavibacteria bacterium]|nr:site-specific DNA-methyltransferase [Ignavibacteria bacterium]
MQTVNKLILAANLEILKQLDSESVDLVYLDPPFFSNRNYEVIWGDAGEVRSFQDRWSGGMDHYIAWLKERVAEMHRILKSTGSIFLHCDWHADAYIRVEILDKIFGMGNFRGDIVWQRTNAHSDARKKLAVLSDTIWYYTKGNESTYNPVYAELGEKYVEDFYKYEDTKGRYRLGDLTNTKPGGYNYEYKGYKPNKNGWRCPLETMQKWDDDGLINFPKNVEGRLSIKRYLNNSKGTLIGNVWTDIQNVQPGKERIGYPTQKPEALLDRIIKMASNESDTVLDPFVGGGTTISVAEKTNRKWIGIDQSVQAVKVTEFRLNSQQNLFSQPFIVQLHKYDYDTLRYKDAFEFESWIITQYGGQPQNKKGGDKGIDGKSKDNTPIQVKRSDNIDVNVIKNFSVSAKQYDKTLFEKNVAENKSVGSIIAFSFGKGAIQEVARLKNQEDVTIKLIRVDEIIPIAKKPTITVEVNELGRDKKDISEIEFTATGNSAAGIEFFSWDFDYSEKDGFKPEIIIDKQGKQQHKFKAGQHIIAVKVVDNDGLDNIELIRLKVNGVVERG